MAQETLEQTQRRLGLSTAPVTNHRSMRQYGPGQRAQAPTVNARGVLRIAVAIGLLVAIGVVGLNVFQAVPQWGVSAVDWSTYPGTVFLDGDKILDGDSLETTQTVAADLTTEIQSELGVYGFRWTKVEESSVSPAPNNYGGTSMLYNLHGDVFVGQVINTHSSSRENIIAAFERIIDRRGWLSFVLNDTMDEEQSLQLFGSAVRDEQALWWAQSHEDDYTGVTALIEVYDSEVPTGDEFSAPMWIGDEPTGTLFVRVSVSASDRLSDGDRDAFVAALEPFESETKPEYRG